MKCSFFRILFPLFVFLSPIVTFASEKEVEVLAVELTNETTEYFYLSEKPVIIFNGDSLKITCHNFIAAIADVIKFTFVPADSVTAVKSVSASKQMSVIYNEGNSLQLKGVSVADVKVYSVDGRVANAEISSQDNGVVVNLNNLYTGVYIIRCKSQSFKIYKK